MMLPAAVLVITYNHAAHIAACLRALLALDDGPAELLVIDNGSSDGTPELVRREFPELRLIETGRNLGFGGGANLGAQQTSAEFIVLANPDMVVRRGWLAALLAPFREDARIGITGGKLLYPDGVTLQHAGGELRWPLGLGYHPGSGEADRGQFDVPRRCEYVTGAAFACRRSVWEQVGGMDERFWPAYYEEVDLCLRVAEAGWEVWYAPGSVATHVEAGGLGRHSAAFYRHYHRNRMRLLRRHRPLDWLVGTWLPAELAYLRGVAKDAEVEALTAVYLSEQLSALTGTDAATLDLPPPDPLAPEPELAWTTRQVAAKATITPRPPEARNPIVAKLRRLLSRLLLADELRDLAQQQSDANRAVAEAVAALARQRRAADAAVALQGMVTLWIQEHPR